MNLRPVNAPDAPGAPTYQQAMEVSGASRILFTSGQIPVAVDGSIPENFSDQSRLAWKNIIAQLTAAGMTLDNLVKVTIFLSDRKYIADYRSTRDEALGGRKVALTPSSPAFSTRNGCWRSKPWLLPRCERDVLLYPLTR